MKGFQIYGDSTVVSGCYEGEIPVSQRRNSRRISAKLQPLHAVIKSVVAQTVFWGEQDSTGVVSDHR